MNKAQIYKVQQSHNNGTWKTIYAPLDNKAQAEVYYQGACAFNGWKCRLLEGRKVIAQKGE